MKYLIFIIILIPFFASANWVSKSSFKSPTIIWKRQLDCETQAAETCIDITGIDLKRSMVDGDDLIVPDPAGITAADAEDAQKDSDKSARDTARGTREIDLQTCIQDSKNPTLTPQQTKDCIAALVREILKDKVDINDL